MLIVWRTNLDRVELSLIALMLCTLAEVTASTSLPLYKYLPLVKNLATH